MNLKQIADMCDKVLNQKAHEYATPNERWHNFITAVEKARDFDRGSLLCLSPGAWACAFAMKHYVSCIDIDRGDKLFDPDVVKEKAGDLLNYYLIHRCIEDGRVSPDTYDWLRELLESQERPWILGLELLFKVNE